MPRRLVTVENPELNHISARGDETLALVFTNQSKQAVRSRVSLNREHVKWTEQTSLTTRGNSGQGSSGALSGEGDFTVDVPGEGVVAVILGRIAPKPLFQPQVFATTPGLSPGSVHDLGWRGAKAFGISFGSDDLTSAYLYLPDFERQVAQCTLRVLEGERVISETTDKNYPFDFTVPTGGRPSLAFTFEVGTSDGKKETSPIARLPLRSQP